MYNKRKEYIMPEEKTTKSPTVVRTNERLERGIELTDKQRASGTGIYFTPAQEGVEFGTSVKAKNTAEAQKLSGVEVPTEDAPATDENVNTDEGSK